MNARRKRSTIWRRRCECDSERMAHTYLHVFVICGSSSPATLVDGEDVLSARASSSLSKWTIFPSNLFFLRLRAIERRNPCCDPQVQDNITWSELELYLAYCQVHATSDVAITRSEIFDAVSETVTYWQEGRQRLHSYRRNQFKNARRTQETPRCYRQPLGSLL